MNDKNNKLEAIPFTGITYEELDEIYSTYRSNITTYYVKLKSNGNRCRKCGTFSTNIHSYKKLLIRHSDNIDISYSQRRYKCKTCNTTFYEEDPFRDEEVLLSKYCVEKILLDLKRYNHTYLEIANKYRVSVTKIIEVFDTYVQIPRKPLREVISIDEIYFSKHSKSKYIFMIIGLNGEILDILSSRKKRKLLDYFKSIPTEERNKVKYVTMDMNDIYKDIIKRRFNNVNIVIDSFHVVKNINEALNKVRLRVLKPYRDKTKSNEYYLLHSRRNILFKNKISSKSEYSHHFKYKYSEKEILNMIIDLNDELSVAHELKDRYLYINNHYQIFKNDKDKVKSFIDDYIDDCISSNIDEFITIGNMINNWKDEIINSFLIYDRKNIRLSNGKIEGKNSYIKKLIKLANGLSNDKRARNRIMYVENLFDKPSDTKLENTIKRKYK